MSDVAEILQSVLRGQHGNVSPDFLPKGQVARLINVAVRGGLATSRPPIREIAPLPANGRFQGAAVYRRNSGDRLVCVVSGEVWVYDDDLWTKAYTFPTIDFEQAYFCQADKYFVVQNGVYEPENWPLILDGDDVFDNLSAEFIWTDAPDDDPAGGWRKISDFAAQTNVSPERDSLRVPIGKSMAFLHGRLFVAVERFWEDGAISGDDPHWEEGVGLRFWLAGDILQADNPAECLVFSETTYLTGKAAGLSSELGFITAMAPFRNAATGSGFGALVFLAREGASGFAPTAERSEWTQSDMGQVLFGSGGSLSPWSLIPVNADLVYFGRDGFRSIRYTASTESGSGSLSSVPLSPEVQKYTDLTSQEHAPFVSMASVDNYVFATCVGATLSDGSTAFRAILPWDVSVLAASSEESPRAFAGAWAGQLYHSAFTMRIGGHDRLGLIYRIGENDPMSFGVVDPDHAPDAHQVSRVYSPRYAFETLILVKKLARIELKFSDIRTAMSYRVGWRPDGDTAWHWTQSSRLASETYPAVSPTLWVQLPRDDSLACLNGRRVSAGMQFEFVIEWTGHARLDYAVFRATTVAGLTGDSVVKDTLVLRPAVGESQSEAVELVQVLTNRRGAV